MASLVPTKAQVGRLSTTFTCVTTVGPDAVNNANLLTVCERGPLYALLNRTYVDTAALIGTLAANGVSINVLSNQVSPDAVFGLDGSNRPALVLSNTTDTATCGVRVALAYSPTK
jgi:hypothetical protein